MDFRGVLGHEFVGTVEDGPAEWRGRRVVGEINFACGRCALCARGLQRHCPTRRVMGILDADGAFAELRRGAGRQPASRARRRRRRGRGASPSRWPRPSRSSSRCPCSRAPSCVVLGDGKLGLLVAQVLCAGGRARAGGRQARRQARHPAARAASRRCCSPDWRRTPADLVVEATGRAAGFAAAVAATRPRGTLVLKSTVAEAAPLNLAPLVINEITVVGSRCGRFAPALRGAAQTGAST